jgi:hypothetical protein
LDPVAVATWFEQRLGIHLPPLVTAFLVLVAAFLLVGAVIQQGVEWSRALKSPGRRARLISISRSTALRAVFSFRFLYRLAAIVWVVLVSASIWRMGHDLNDYALPRQLTHHQKDAISSKLLAHREFPDIVKLIVQDGDEEAAGFGSDLFQTLEKGGWPVIVSRSANLGPGLALAFYVPTEAEKKMEDRARERAGSPELPLGEVLRLALCNAGVRVDGGVSAGPSYRIPTILVGPRRRDRGISPQPGCRDP